jgi:ABC-type transport system involved in multi-copper enzyme maturation permease subunit
MTAARVVVGYTLRELTRRKVFVVVPIVTFVFVTLYLIGNLYAFRFSRGLLSEEGGLVDGRVVTGASLVGLAMFTTFFLGTVLAVFLTFASVRGDAEAGLLQPLVVRPVGRAALLAGRYVATVIVTGAYVFLLYAAAVVVTGVVGDWWPEHLLSSGLYLAAGMTIVAALSMLGSVFMSTIPNGIAVLMVYGAGLLGGLLGQIGDALSSTGLERTGRIASWVVPFEALYQAALHELTSGATGVAAFVVRLGPLGGADPAGDWLAVWAALYVIVIGALTLRLFARKDL